MEVEMANTAVDICNLALSHIKESPITRITGTQDEPLDDKESKCALWYDITRKSLLRSGSWNFAIKRASLVKVSGEDAYLLPSDNIKILALGEDYSLENYFVEQGKIISTDEQAKNLRYIFNNEDVSTFDPLFVLALSYDLAKNLSFAFNSSATEVSRLEDQRDKYISKAMRVDGQERPPIKIDRTRQHNRSIRRVGRDFARTAADL